jgi:hypothetical protein
MSEKLSHSRKNLKKVEVEIDSMANSNEYLGFIVGYTSNGAPYGLTHEEWDKVNKSTHKKDLENNNTDSSIIT